MADGECHICKMGETAEPEEVVYKDEFWTAGTVANVPGFIMLWANRHVEGSWGLSSEEAEGFGPLMSGVSKAVRDASQADRVYLMYLGENALHFHAMLIPRSLDDPPEFRGPGVVAKMPEMGNRPEALRLAEVIRSKISIG